MSIVENLGNAEKQREKINNRHLFSQNMIPVKLVKFEVGIFNLCFKSGRAITLIN